MEPGTTFPSTVSSKETTRNTNRLGPLHTCGTAMLTTAYKAYKITETLPGPVGYTTQKLSKCVGPILYIIQYQWLAILAFLDDQILTVENIVETLFPPSAYVFEKIDSLAHISETLPGRFVDAVDKFPMMILRVPYLNWAAAQLVIILNFLVTTLTDWGVDGAKEKEITIDMNSRDENEEMSITNADHHAVASESSVDRDDGEEDVKQLRETYKEILIRKKDVNEEMEKEEEKAMKKDNETTYKMILEMGIKKEEDHKMREEEVLVGTKKEETEESQKVQKQKTHESDGGTTCRKMRREEDDQEEMNLNIPRCVKDFRSIGKSKFHYQRLKIRY